MAIYYSATTNSFYDSNIIEITQMPEDSKIVTDANYKALMDAQCDGHVITANSDGTPCAITQQCGPCSGLIHDLTIATANKLGHVKGGGNVSIDANGVMNANIDLSGYALDSNVVHKSGNETINGVKSFGGMLKATNGTVQVGADTGYSVTFNYNGNITSKQARGTYSIFLPENSGTLALTSDINGKANDSDVVHKTGNETIAGNKTFSNRVSFPSEYYITTDTNDNSLRIIRDGTGHGNNYKVIIQGDTGKFFAPNGFIGNLQGNADTATKASCLDSNVGANKIYLDWDSQVKGYVGLKVDNTVMGGIITTKDIGYQNAVHKTGNETINGVKTFTNDIYFKNNYIDLSVTPSSNMYSNFIFTDKNNQVVSYMQYAKTLDDDVIGLFIKDKDKNLHGIQITTNNEVIPISNNTYSLGSSTNKWANVYASEINTKYFTYTHDTRTSYSYLPKTSGTLAIQERTRASAVVENRTLLYECAGGLDKGDITLNDVYSKFNALLIVYSDDDGDYMSTYYLDCAELDIRREVAGSGTFLLVDGHSYWACTGASTGYKFVHATNNGLRIHKIYGLAKYY